MMGPSLELGTMGAKVPTRVYVAFMEELFEAIRNHEMYTIRKLEPQVRSCVPQSRVGSVLELIHKSVGAIDAFDEERHLVFKLKTSNCLSEGDVHNARAKFTTYARGPAGESNQFRSDLGARDVLGD